VSRLSICEEDKSSREKGECRAKTRIRTGDKKMTRDEVKTRGDNVRREKTRLK